MKVLLDTHALLWWSFDDPKLSTRARAVIKNPVNGVLVSNVSARPRIKNTQQIYAAMYSTV